MHSRFARWQNMSNVSRLIFDRSIDEDARVFCRMHREFGFLDEEQYRQLEQLARDLQGAMPNPDLIVFICPERRTLAQRVRRIQRRITCLRLKTSENSYSPAS